jgi:hypothetical protein
MSRRGPIEVLPTNLLAHPAVQAWHELRPSRVEPEYIETLRAGKKSAVYRLHGVGLAGAPVVAKRCATAIGLIERTIYEDVLPHVRVTALHYYGFVADAAGQHCWLFLEDTRGVVYSRENAEHRALVGQWLGRMHTGAAQVAAAARLSDGGPSRYLEHLHGARETIRQNLHHPALSADDVALLKAIIGQCDVLEERWQLIEQCCASMPRTLVHGDLGPRNAHVRTDAEGMHLYPIDWEMAGWGVPAADITRGDVTAYWSVVRDTWPNLDVNDIQRLANVGQIFRRLAAIRWESLSLVSPRVDWSIVLLQSYHAGLTDAMRVVGWDNLSGCSAEFLSGRGPRPASAPRRPA